MKKVKFKQWECDVGFGTYVETNGTYLLLKQEGEVITKATVCIPEANLNSEEVAIKDYAENQGVLYGLIAAGIIAKPHRFFTMQYPDHNLEVPICNLLVKPEERKAA